MRRQLKKQVIYTNNFLRLPQGKKFGRHSRKIYCGGLKKCRSYFRGHSETNIIFISERLSLLDPNFSVRLRFRIHCGFGVNCGVIIGVKKSQSFRNAYHTVIPKMWHSFRKDGHNHSKTMVLICDKSLMGLFQPTV